MQRVNRAIVIGMLGVGLIGIDAASAGDARKPTTLQVPKGAGMTAAAIRTTGRAGEVFPVDVYLSNIDDLGGYQIKLTATGGTQGTLTFQDATLDKSRKDFAFATAPIIDTVSRVSGILLVAKNVPIVVGSTNIGKPRYAGTFNLIASPDAKGVFSILVEKGPAASIITNTLGQNLAFESGTTPTITIGSVRPKRPTSGR